MAERIKSLLMKMVPERISEGTINEVLALREWVPGLKRLVLHFDDGRVEVEAEAEYQGLKLKAKGGARVKGIKITAEEQVFRILPLGPIQLTTEHEEVEIKFREGPGLVKEWALLSSFLPAELRAALVFCEEDVTLLAHRAPRLSEELRRRTTREVFGKRFSLLDFVEIQDVVLEPGAVRLQLGQKKENCSS